MSGFQPKTPNSFAGFTTGFQQTPSHGPFLSQSKTLSSIPPRSFGSFNQPLNSASPTFAPKPTQNSGFNINYSQFNSSHQQATNPMQSFTGARNKPTFVGNQAINEPKGFQGQNEFKKFNEPPGFKGQRDFKRFGEQQGFNRQAEIRTFNETRKFKSEEEMPLVNQSSEFRGRKDVKRSNEPSGFQGEQRGFRGPQGLNQDREIAGFNRMKAEKEFKAHTNDTRIEEEIDDGDDHEDLEELERIYRVKALGAFNRIRRAHDQKSAKSIKIPERLYANPDQIKPKPPSAPQKSVVLPKPPVAAPQTVPKTSSSAPATKPPKSSQLPTMCSPEECRSRQESMQLSIFEREPNAAYEHRPEWTIKKYLRSSADREEYKRTASDLTYTLNYLLANIIDLDSDGNPNGYLLPENCEIHEFLYIYPFVFDRMRAIVKDWKMLKQSESEDYVEDHEKIARFLILTCVEGFGCEGFNMNLNLKLTEDVLNCLVRAYEERRGKETGCENQAEFIAYFIMTKPDNMLQILTMLKGLPEKILKNSYLALALRAFKAYHSEDFSDFFMTFEFAPYLFVCACYPLFHKIRIYLLDQLYKSSSKSLPMNVFAELLYFTNPYEAELYAKDIGLSVERGSEFNTVILKDISDKQNHISAYIPENIQSKRPECSRVEIITTPEIVEDYVEEESEEQHEVLKENQDIIEIPRQDLKLVEKVEPVVVEKLTQTDFKKVIQEDVKVKKIEEVKIMKTEPIEYVTKAEVKKIEMETKKIAFKFPVDDSSIFNLLKGSKNKGKIIENIREYRKNKKQQRKKREKQQELIFKLKIFNSWKLIAAKNQLEKYIKRRKIMEQERFRLQFSTAIISDCMSQSRFLNSIPANFT